MKERFKKIKPKGKEKKENATPIFRTPHFLEKQYHICMVTENGIFILKNHSCTILYKIIQDSGSNTGVEIPFFEVLRSYDFEYRFFYYGIEEIYLEVLIKSENQSKSINIERIEQMEQDMLFKLFDCGIILKTVCLDERLRLIHKRICQYDDAADKNVMNYQNHVEVWKDDVELKSYVFDENILRIGDYQIKMAFVREFSKTPIKECVQQLLSIEDMECVMIQYSPVKDETLKAFFNSNYMGCDNELRELQTKNPMLYKILSGNTLSDTRAYCFMGIHLLYTQKNSIDRMTSNQELNNAHIKEQFDFGIDRYGAKISDYQTNALDTLKEFIPLGKWNYHQCRLFLDEDIKNTIPVANQNPLGIQEKYSADNRNEFFM